MKNINLLFSFFLVVSPAASFAKVDIGNLPWYFKPNNIQDCWEQSKGRGVVVEIWDSKVYFGSLLKNKKYGHENCVADCNKELSRDKNVVHGTAMASLIAADVGKEKCSARTIYACEESLIAGLAPDSKVFNRELINHCGDLASEDRFKLMIDSLNLAKIENNTNAFGKKILIDEDYVREAKIVIINASLVETKGRYNDILGLVPGLKKEDNFPYLLIVAGVGNDGKKLTDDIIKYYDQTEMPMPAGLKIKGLSVLKVGASSKYDSQGAVDLASFSNYGELVDILAPGEQIPILAPGPIDWQSKLPNGFEERVWDGTSEATAIVTGALTLMAACNPRAKAVELKQALLNDTDKYERLKTKVKDGRVLNVYKAVKNYCNNEDIVTHVTPEHLNNTTNFTEGFKPFF